MRQDIEFQADGPRLRGWLITPDAAAPPFPSVVMAHSINPAHWSACRRSATLAWTSRPSACSACDAASRCSALLDEIATRQPSAASARADA